MLVSEIAPDSIVFVKLSSGEEIIGKFKTQQETTVTLGNVLSLIQVPDGKGGVGFQFLPYVNLGDYESEYQINKANITIMPSKPLEDFEKNYITTDAHIIKSINSNKPPKLSI